MDNLKIYDWDFNPEIMSGINLISLVENPATEIIAIAMSKQSVLEFKLANEEQRILVSPILIPEQLIYRADIDGEPAYFKASKETIANIQEHFVKMGNQNNSSIEHSGTPIKGITFTEQWLVKDSKQDTINAYGFSNVPEGSWCVKAKLSQELWDDFVKSGKVKGFSVEGMLGLKLTNNNNNNEIKLKKMNKETIEQIVMAAIKSVALASDLKEMVAKDGKSYFASALELDAIVTDVDGNLVPDAEFVFEGNVYKTDATGAISEISNVEEETTETETEDVVLADVVSDVVSVDVQALNDKIAEQEKIIADLEAKNIELEAKLVEMESASVEMSNQTPASTGIKDVPTVSNEKESITDMLKRLR